MSVVIAVMVINRLLSFPPAPPQGSHPSPPAPTHIRVDPGEVLPLLGVAVQLIQRHRGPPIGNPLGADITDAEADAGADNERPAVAALVVGLRPHAQPKRRRRPPAAEAGVGLKGEGGGQG
jgi:hypothetical protein